MIYYLQSNACLVSSTTWCTVIQSYNIYLSESLMVMAKKSFNPMYCIDFFFFLDSGKQHSHTTKVCNVCETQMTGLICAARPRTQRCPLVSKMWDMCSTPSSLFFTFHRFQFPTISLSKSRRAPDVAFWTVYLRETYRCKHFSLCLPTSWRLNTSPRSAGEECWPLFVLFHVSRGSFTLVHVLFFLGTDCVKPSRTLACAGLTQRETPLCVISGVNTSWYIAQVWRCKLHCDIKKGTYCSFSRIILAYCYSVH